MVKEHDGVSASLIQHRLDNGLCPFSTARSSVVFHFLKILSLFVFKNIFKKTFAV